MANQITTYCPNCEVVDAIHRKEYGQREVKKPYKTDSYGKVLEYVYVKEEYVSFDGYRCLKCSGEIPYPDCRNRTEYLSAIKNSNLHYSLYVPLSFIGAGLSVPLTWKLATMLFGGFWSFVTTFITTIAVFNMIKFFIECLPDENKYKIIAFYRGLLTFTWVTAVSIYVWVNFKNAYLKGINDWSPVFQYLYAIADWIIICSPGMYMGFKNAKKIIATFNNLDDEIYKAWSEMNFEFNKAQDEKLDSEEENKKKLELLTLSLEVLELNSQSWELYTVQDIKDAYKKVAKKYHPDLFQKLKKLDEGSYLKVENRFKVINKTRDFLISFYIKVDAYREQKKNAA